MKRLFSLSLIFLVSMLQAQVSDIVNWSYSSNKVSENEYELVIEAKIKEHWHLYSQYLESADGPIATEFRFFAGDEEGGVKHAEIIGKTEESGNLLKEHDPNFNMVLSYYADHAKFTQRIKVLDPNKIVKGDIYYMVCDEKQCLPPEVIDFTFNPKTNVLSKVILKPTQGFEEDKNPFFRKAVDTKNPVINCEVKAEETEGKGMGTVFLLGFFGGLIALLTPCVFPMIPLTVSFFTKGSKDKKKGKMNAFLYGFFIFGIYLLLSVPFHVLDGVSPDILNNISTSVTLNIIFFVVFLFFAFSFFGYYEITLPAKFTNKMDSASDVGGIIGIFFMALTLALVSFSCTGPILGSLLAGSLTADGGAWLLSSGMGGFGLALALPFALFAMFPSMMNSLPSSGGWLNSVKVVLGFAEVALAFKFLSNADLVEHWGILKYETFYVIWIICAIGTGLYLLGKIKFPHDSPIKSLSLTRKVLAVAFLGFAVYLGTAFRYDKESETYAPLSVMSGLAPSPGYSYIYPSHCPLALNCFHDYEEGLAYAKQVNKPVLVDFTGHACVNCRKMEDNVWPVPEIKKIISEEYVLISLYVDDREELPKEDQINYEIKSSGAVKPIRTVGDKWSTLQSETFGSSSQPWYCLISPEEKLLTASVGYTPDVSEYRQFLECGLEGFKKVKK